MDSQEFLPEQEIAPEVGAITCGAGCRRGCLRICSPPRRRKTALPSFRERPSICRDRRGKIIYIRLNYTFPPRNRIAEGIRVLCEVIRKLTVSEWILGRSLAA